MAASSAGELRRGRLIGSPVRRVEDSRLVTGEARYVGDLKLPRMVHARFVRSPVPHARIRQVDTTEAASCEGVRAILTGADLAAIAPLVDDVPLPALLKTPQPIIAHDRVRFAGEAVALVVADDPYLAEDAAGAVIVDYESLDAVASVQRGLENDSPPLFDELGTNVIYRESEEIGEVSASFASAAHIFETLCHTNRFMAAPMETRGCIAEFGAAAGELTVWASTQTPHALRMAIATRLGLPEHHVRVIAPHVGGAFGQKISPHPEEIAIAFAAMRLRQPVKWVEDRRENLLAATHAKEQVISLRAAVDDDGTLRALKATCVGDAGGYSFNATAGVLVEPQVAAKLMPGVYRLDAYSFEVVGVLTNKAPIGAYRGIGWTACETARELLFDEIARKLGLDPVEFRLRNMVGPDDFPHVTCTGQRYDSGSFKDSIGRVTAALGYERFRRDQKEAWAQGRYEGIGVSPWVEPTGYGSRIGAEIGLPNPSHDSVRVTVEPSGTVTVATGFVSQGQGHETIFAQVAADAFGISIDNVRVVQGDTDSTPFGLGTFASRSAVIGAGATSKATGLIRLKLLNVAAAVMEASIDDLVLEDGAVSVAGSPDARMTLSELAAAAYFGGVELPDGGDTSLTVSSFYDPLGTYSNGCVGVVVDVDPATGLVNVRRIVVAEDCGRVLNPLIVEGQVRGAVAQGVGGALLEALVYDGDAQLLTTTFMDYLLPTTTEIPPIEVIHLETLAPDTVGGVKGMGESGMVATPAAVLCAVMDALAPFGPMLRTLPLTPTAIVEMLAESAGPT